ncbi:MULTISPECIES: general stress protein [Paenibacillus]|uniref:General stress protein n=1 Tax=Paenibacillus helianthi TaxID=1349432 RepID=A0ABX3EQZ6_9BACL|nr:MULTISPECIES: general stress protein [Paenibacillus]OKP67924.1 general stress protein [Paenibacillus sp. P3E]OKP86237.1 general stress protein [Paenibacillus helianthi]OKP96625.1 general stress protein [Paenibacillus sp. P46E]
MDSIRTQAYAKLLENGIQAIEEVNRLRDSGYTRDDIYVISHNADREGRIVDAADTNEVGLHEEGLFGSIANMFRSRGDALRNKITSLGFSAAEAGFYEKELDTGKVLVIAKKNLH